MSMSLEKVLQLGRLRMGDTATVGIKFLETCLRLTTNFLSAVLSLRKSAAQKNQFKVFVQTQMLKLYCR